MSNHSFDIQTANDFLRKLHEEYEDFQQDPLSSRHAINCALTGWHLIEWVWNDYEPKLKLQSSSWSSLSEFRKDIKTAHCPEMAIMEGIANGSKHVAPRNTGGIQSTELHKGGFSRGFSRDFDISRLDITLADGSRVMFDDVIKEVVDFWDQFFNTYL